MLRRKSLEDFMVHNGFTWAGKLYLNVLQELNTGRKVFGERPCNVGDFGRSGGTSGQRIKGLSLDETGGLMFLKAMFVEGRRLAGKEKDEERRRKTRPRGGIYSGAEGGKGGGKTRIRV